MSADERMHKIRAALKALPPAIAPRPRQRGVQRALEFLRTFLELDDLIAVVAVRDAATARGVSWASVRRAARAAGISVIRIGGRHGGWFWTRAGQSNTPAVAAKAGARCISRALWLRAHGHRGRYTQSLTRTSVHFNAIPRRRPTSGQLQSGMGCCEKGTICVGSFRGTDDPYGQPQ